MLENGGYGAVWCRSDSGPCPNPIMATSSWGSFHDDSEDLHEVETARMIWSCHRQIKKESMGMSGSKC